MLSLDSSQIELRASVLWIIIKLETAMTEYQKVYEERLPALDKLLKDLKLSSDDQIYYEYFVASIIKRLGMHIESRELFN